MTTTRYVYFGNQYIGETDGNNVAKQRYVSEPDAYTHLLGQHDVAANEDRYYHFDAIGSTRQVTDESGTVIAEITYDSWGKVLARTGMNLVPFQYVGEHGYYREEATEQYYVIARIYDSRIIRWLSVDPLSTEQFSDSEYAYSTNDPITKIDHSGLEAATVVIGGVVVSITALEAAAAAFGLSIWACINHPPCINAAREKARDTADRVKDKVKKCRCKNRHPNYPSCPWFPWDTPRIALRKTERNKIKGWLGPIPGPCEIKGNATNCGAAGGVWYQCEEHYIRRGPTGKIIRDTVRASVSCCKCCHTFVSGFSCKVNHPKKPSGKKPFPLPV